MSATRMSTTQDRLVTVLVAISASAQRAWTSLLPPGRLRLEFCEDGQLTSRLEGGALPEILIAETAQVGASVPALVDLAREHPEVAVIAIVGSERERGAAIDQELYDAWIAPDPWQVEVTMRHAIDRVERDRLLRDGTGWQLETERTTSRVVAAVEQIRELSLDRTLRMTDRALQTAARAAAPTLSRASRVARPALRGRRSVGNQESPPRIGQTGRGKKGLPAGSPKPDLLNHFRTRHDVVGHRVRFEADVASQRVRDFLELLDDLVVLATQVRVSRLQVVGVAADEVRILALTQVAQERFA